LSRDTIAMSTVVALSHAMYDGVFCLGVCDKIVPGLVIGALAFGHLPAIFVPAGPMPSGLPNEEKSSIRKLYVQGKVDRAALLQAESASYHAPGTCTFYGTANTNQMIMEVMGLHVAGGTFVNPGTPLRQALTEEAGRRLVQLVASQAPGIGWQLDERAFANALIGIAATGGSTNLAIHLIAMARAAGIQLDWADFQAASDFTPLLTRVYPNGKADVNHFHAAGGLGFLIRQLLDAGLLHSDIPTAMGDSLEVYAVEAGLGEKGLQWHPAPTASRNEDVLRPLAKPFQVSGGLKLMRGNLGRAILKTSAMPQDRYQIQAPARVFSSQEHFNQAFARGALQGDVVVVVRFQGPRANGMPELHKLTPALATLQEQGFRVALLTDGRMSGASGSVPAAIHLVPEAALGGPLARVQDGDIIRLDVDQGILEILVDETEWAMRQPARQEEWQPFGHGREYFAPFRRWIGSAEEGASILALQEERS
jgi:phosphogluconate dehydratase